MGETIKGIFKQRFVKYLIAAGTATIVDIVVYTILFNTLGESRKFFCLINSYSCGLVTNFLISKYFVFPESGLNSSSQFVRFAAVAVVVLIANYYMMLGLEWLIPFPSFLSIAFKPLLIRGLSAALIAFVSFYTHKLFSFDV